MLSSATCSNAIKVSIIISNTNNIRLASLIDSHCYSAEVYSRVQLQNALEWTFYITFGIQHNM